jgi:hypothetical protein
MADDSTAFAFRHKHKLQIGVYECYHLLDQLSDFPLRSCTQSLVGNVDKFTQVAGEVEGGGASVGKNVTSVLVGSAALLVMLIPSFEAFHIRLETEFIHCIGQYVIESVLRAISLTPLRETTVAVSHQLMGARAGDPLDFEGEIDMLEYTVMTVAV